MQFIQHQFTESNQRYYAYGIETFLVALAKDRKVVLQGIDDLFVLSIARYGMETTRLHMSEKMFHMVRETILEFDPRKAYQVGLFEVDEQNFEGDFLAPGVKVVVA